MQIHHCVHSGECPYCFDVYNKTFSDTTNLTEIPLFKINLCYTYL